MEESDASFFWDITRRIPEDLNLEQNRCENLEPYEATEHCVGVRIFIFVMLSSNLDPETVCSDQNIHKFPHSLQSNAGIVCSSWQFCSLLYHFRLITR
jgi:hypothetical protein